MDTQSTPVLATPVVHNIVATANLGCTFVLRDIALKVANSEYRPKRFAAVIVRLREPKTTALVFASGKVVITGAKDEKAAKAGMKKYAKILRELGYQTELKDFKIQNMVANCDAQFPIKLEALFQSEHKRFSRYDPEMFAGLVYKMHSPKVVLLIFVSGKVVFTGAKTRQDIDTAWHNIYTILRNFRKNADSK